MIGFAIINEERISCDINSISLIIEIFFILYFSECGPTITVMSVIPNFLNTEICLSSIDFPLTSINDFGVFLVSSPNLEPIPAATMIAFILNFFLD